MAPSGPNLKLLAPVKPDSDLGSEDIDTVTPELSGSLSPLKGGRFTSPCTASTVCDGASSMSSLCESGGSRSHGAALERAFSGIWGGGELEAEMLQGAPAARPWDPSAASRMRMLQNAARNHGSVDLMKYKSPGAAEGVMVAVKVMPARWVRRSPQEFSEKYPDGSERPWLDFATIALLNKREAPFACKLFGVFFDSETCYVVQSLANMGDFFGYCEKLPAPGPAREAQLKPILAQTFSAVRQLHDFGVGHRDLSLENFVLHNEGGHVQVKLIDYGMATLKRFCSSEVRGKLSYQAPEMHADAEYDVFLTDAFAIGVIVYACTVYDYPWTATKPSSCRYWSFFVKNGLLKMVEQRKLRGKSKRLVEVMSPELIELIGGLVDVDARSRLCLGEACFRASGRAAASTGAWTPGGDLDESQRTTSSSAWIPRAPEPKSSKASWSGRLFSFRGKQ